MIQSILLLDITATFPNNQTQLSFIITGTILCRYWNIDSSGIWPYQCRSRLGEEDGCCRNWKVGFLGDISITIESRNKKLTAA